MAVVSKVLVRRPWVRVIYEVLVCCNAKPALTEHICRRANLSNSSFHRVAADLVSCGFLSESEVEGHVFYLTTRLGFEFVRKYGELRIVARPLERFFGDTLV